MPPTPSNEPSLTTAPTDTATGSTPAPTPTPSAAAFSACPTPGAPGKAFSVTTGLAYSGTSGMGAVEVVVLGPGGSRTGVYTEVHKAKADVLGKPIVGDRVANANSDSSGAALMEVKPGTYSVTTDLPGYNWGDLQDGKGQSGITVRSGRRTRVTISLGSITFVPTKVDGVITGKYAEIHLQKTDSQGGVVTGDRVGDGNTDNTGALTILVTPGSYVLTSDFDGHNWGDLSDGKGCSGVSVGPRDDTKVELPLGRLRVAIPAGKYAEVHLGTAAAPGDRVASGNADNTGYWATDLVPGAYVLVVDDHASEVTVEAGQVTDTATGSTPAPTPTPSAAAFSACPTPGAPGKAFSVTTGLAYSGTSGMGAVEVVVLGPGGSRTGVYTEVHKAKADVLGKPIVGDRVANANSDSSGAALMEVKPGTYSVTTDLPGYNWGDLQDGKGQSGITVRSGRRTRVTISLGSITFVPTKVDGVITGKYAEIHLQKTDSQGGVVTGDRVGDGNTDNTGALTILVTPGSYVLTSDFDGHNWGDLSDGKGCSGVSVGPRDDTKVELPLGRLRVAIPAGKYAEVHLGTAAAPGDRVASGNADNTGYWATDLVPGAYVLVVDDHASEVTVEAGQVTDS